MHKDDGAERLGRSRGERSSCVTSFADTTGAKLTAEVWLQISWLVYIPSDQVIVQGNGAGNYIAHALYHGKPCRNRDEPLDWFLSRHTTIYSIITF